AVLGAKLWIVQLYGSPLPMWDQWAEARSCFLPLAQGQFSLATLFIPNNEHRIVLPKLLDVLLIQANGRWEPLVQMTANCLLHAVFAVALTTALWHFLGRQKGWLVCALVAPFFVLPFGAENTVWAFNSQHYFLSFCALLTLAGLGFARPGSVFWWLGLTASIGGLFSMASGFLAPAALVGLALLRLLKARRWDWANGSLILLGIAIITAGLAAMVHMPGDTALKAHSPSEFFVAWGRNLAWPFVNHALWLWPLLLLPLLVLLGLYLRPRFAAPAAAEFLFALAGWSILQSAALAYGRANYGDGFPVSRYMDVLAWLTLASLAAVWLLQKLYWDRPLAALIPWVLMVIVGFQLAYLSSVVVDQLLKPTLTANLLGAERVQAYVTRWDKTDFLTEPTIHPDPKFIAGVLEEKALVPLLPHACLPAGQQPAPGPLDTLAASLYNHALFLLSTGLGLFAGLLLLGPARRDLIALLLLLGCLGASGAVWSQAPQDRATTFIQAETHLVTLCQLAGHPERAAWHAARAAAYAHHLSEP
ncbi:MAG TPA: hypothetical protein VF607_05470, partial [Verrucomicrobiae bacterium]